jgi:hypothetical protein
LKESFVPYLRTKSFLSCTPCLVDHVPEYLPLLRQAAIPFTTFVDAVDDYKAGTYHERESSMDVGAGDKQCHVLPCRHSRWCEHSNHDLYMFYHRHLQNPRRAILPFSGHGSDAKHSTILSLTVSSWIPSCSRTMRA